MIKRIVTDDRTLSRQAYHAIREAILSNDLLPNTAISINDLSRRLGVSPTPVREAIKWLEADGLVTSEAYRGIRIAAVSSDDVRDTYEVRLAMEPLVARTAAERALCDRLLLRDLGTLKEKASRLLSAVKRKEQGLAWAAICKEVDLELNEILLRATRNALLRGIFMRVSDHSRRIRTFVEATCDSDISAVVLEMTEEHLDIIKALCEGDGNGAARNVRAHLRSARRRTLESLGRSGDETHLRALTECDNRTGTVVAENVQGAEGMGDRR